jgi:hypothetical protein
MIGGIPAPDPNLFLPKGHWNPPIHWGIWVFEEPFFLGFKPAIFGHSTTVQLAFFWGDLTPWTTGTTGKGLFSRRWRRITKMGNLSGLWMIVFWIYLDTDRSAKWVRDQGAGSRHSSSGRLVPSMMSSCWKFKPSQSSTFGFWLICRNVWGSKKELLLLTHGWSSETLGSQEFSQNWISWISTAFFFHVRSRAVFVPLRRN